MISVKKQTIVNILILFNLLTHVHLLQINADRDETYVVGESQRGVVTTTTTTNSTPIRTETTTTTEPTATTTATTTTTKSAITITTTTSATTPTAAPTTTTATTTSTTAATATMTTTTTTTTTTAGTTTTTTTTTIIPIHKRKNIYRKPLPLLNKAEIENVQEISAANRNFLDRSASNTFHPTAYPQYNNEEIQENYDTTTTNRDESVYSKPLGLINPTEPKNIHEVPIIYKSTTKKPEEEKSHQFSVPQYHRKYGGEELEDDETTKSMYAEEPKIKDVSTTDFPQYHSGETMPTDCKYCCSEEKNPCALCCDVGPNLSEGLLKSSGG